MGAEYAMRSAKRLLISAVLALALAAPSSASADITKDQCLRSLKGQTSAGWAPDWDTHRVRTYLETAGPYLFIAISEPSWQRPEGYGGNLLFAFFWYYMDTTNGAGVRSIWYRFTCWRSNYTDGWTYHDGNEVRVSG
jgi:hypothetical protein